MATDKLMRQATENVPLTVLELQKAKDLHTKQVLFRSDPEYKASIEFVIILKGTPTQCSNASLAKGVS